MIKKTDKIMVVMGGMSTEREVSLRSGLAVYHALKNLGYSKAVAFDLKEDNAKDIIEAKPDRVFFGAPWKVG